MDDRGLRHSYAGVSPGKSH